MKQNPEQKQVSLAGAAMSKPGSAAAQKSKQPRRRRWIVLTVILLLIAAGIIGYSVYKKVTAGPSLTGREMVEYTYTPDDKLGRVSYYLLGVTGANATDRMDMLAVLCLDRHDKAISILQIPVAAWLGESDLYAVKEIGDIWGHPKEITWCATCRRRVTTDEVSGGKHSACGTAVESRTGSALTNLIGAVNEQYGLPIDNYLVIPRAGLSQLIDAVGGIDLTLEKKLSYNGVDYEAGAQILSGEAAVYYVTEYSYDGSPNSDVARMERQRQLLAGLLARLSRYKESELYNSDPNKADVLSAIMSGRNPVRYDTTSFGKARLMGRSSDSSSDGVGYTQALAEWIHTVSSISLDKVRCCILPGVQARVGSTNVYSPVRSDLLTLLNECFNPAGLTIDDTTVKAKECVTGKTGDPKTVTLDTLLTQQSEPTTTAPPTTTAAAEDTAEE